MKSMQFFSVILLLLSFTCRSLSYDLVFNTDKDIAQWKFNGSYIYSKSIPNVAALLPMSLVRSSKENDIFRTGVWLVRYSGPDAENFLSLHYSLKHHLFKQGVVHFIASPNVPLTVTTTNDQEVGKFWSDGKTWCDALFNVNLYNSITIDMETQQSGDYVLIDKIVMGVMSDLQMSGRQLNPCLTSPPDSSSLTEDDMAPDMTHKPPPPRRANDTHMHNTPPDMISKPSHSHSHLRGSSGGSPPPPPDMVEKTKVPPLDTSTVTTSNDSENETEPETNNSSDVKCGCSCTCSRVKGKKSTNNATMTASG